AEQFHFQPALLLGLAQCGGFRVFVQFDVPAKWQPLVQVAVVNDQHLALVNDKDGDGEVNSLVDVGHGGGSYIVSWLHGYKGGKAAFAPRSGTGAPHATM